MITANVDDVSKWTEVLTKAAVSFVGIAYVIGLLIVNLHLREYGVFSTSVLRVEFVMAGSLWLALTAFGYLLLMIVVTSVRYAWKKWRTDKFGAAVRVISGVAVVLLLGGGIIAFLSGNDFHLTSPHDLAMLGVLLTTPAAMISARQWAKRAWDVVRDAEVSTESLWTELLQIGALLTSLSWYATFVYPRLLPIYGGGRPTVVTALVSSEVMPMFGSSTKAPTFLVNYDLVAETPEWFVFATHGSHSTTTATRVAVKVRRESVLSISTRGQSLWSSHPSG